MASDDRGAKTPRTNARIYAAEMLGTGVLVFIGCGSVVSNSMSGGSAGLVGVALCFGIAVAMMIFAVGPISGAHINPAVTVALAATGHFPRKQVLPYIGAQAAGAVLASVLHRIVFTSEVALKASYGATTPTVPIANAVGLEVVMTFILMYVIMAFATDSRAPSAMAAFAIGAVVVGDIVLGGPVTGASLNPARSFGPALLAGGSAMTNYWIYLVGPIVGAVLGAFCYESLRERGLPADVEDDRAVVEQQTSVAEPASR
jgi:aquaporin NIP